MIQVLLVEDDPMARQLLEIYVKNSENYNLIQSVESAMFAEVCCRTNPVDLILMDVCTAMNASGLEAAEKIKKSFPAIKVIFTTKTRQGILFSVEELLIALPDTRSRLTLILPYQQTERSDP